MDINSIFESGGVERFHTVPGITKQTVATHSWGVAMLCQHFKPDCSKELLLAAMTHDCAELYTGDIPAPFKWDNPDVKPFLDEYEQKVENDMGINFALDEVEARLLKLCDALEGMRYCLYRLDSGERAAMKPFSKWMVFVAEKYELSEEESAMYHSLVGYAQEVVCGSK